MPDVCRSGMPIRLADRFFSLVVKRWIVVGILFRAHEVKLNCSPFVEHFNFLPGGFSVISHFEELLTFHFVEDLRPAFFKVIFDLFLNEFVAFRFVVNLCEEFFRLHELGGEFFYHETPVASSP